MLLMLFMGVYPRPFLDRSKAAVEMIRARVMQTPAGGSIETANLERRTE
jgi:NADH:ubiquinone oxidoreductase subunit 4 (subunit M)